MKREVYRCDCLQFLVHFYSQVLLMEVLILISVVSTFCWDLHRAILVVYYTAILCHKLVLLVLVRLIAIKIFNRSAALMIIAVNM